MKESKKCYEILSGPVVYTIYLSSFLYIIRLSFYVTILMYLKTLIHLLVNLNGINKINIKKKTKVVKMSGLMRSRLLLGMLLCFVVDHTQDIRLLDHRFDWYRCQVS